MVDSEIDETVTDVDNAKGAKSKYGIHIDSFIIYHYESHFLDRTRICLYIAMGLSSWVRIFLLLALAYEQFDDLRLMMTCFSCIG